MFLPDDQRFTTTARATGFQLMKMSALSAVIRIACISIAAVPSIVLAQFSDSYNFLKAVRDKEVNKVNEIISKPGSGAIIIDTRDNATGEGAIHIVTKRRDTQWMAFLLSKGAKADLRDNRGETPLLAATQVGFIEGAALLLKGRASVDAANNSGETPLIRAVQRRDLKLVNMFLAAGANPDKRDRLAGKSARDYAKADARGAAVLKLLEAPQTAKKPVAGPSL
jgi:uncharacterized protein